MFRLVLSESNRHILGRLYAHPQKFLFVAGRLAFLLYPVVVLAELKLPCTFLIMLDLGCYFADEFGDFFLTVGSRINLS